MPTNKTLDFIENNLRRNKDGKIVGIDDALISSSSVAMMVDHIREMRDIINDLVLVIGLYVIGDMQKDETDGVKVDRLIDRACELAGLPKDMSDIARFVNAEYPPTELERLRQSCNRAFELLKNNTPLFSCHWWEIIDTWKECNNLYKKDEPE